MQVDVELHPGPLPPAPPWHIDTAGAAIRFEGVVRPTEQGQPLVALDYQQYPPMTERELRRLAEQIAQQHGLLGLRVAHSHGRVPVGKVSFRLDVASKHRAEGLAAMDAFINRLKREVPLWKLPVYATASAPTSAPTHPEGATP
ncbi:MAG: molybdenum cofactor biosynthesis protein MoaE [Phycisphaeraceae bacterium]